MLVFRGIHKDVFPLGRAFIDSPVKRQVQDWTVRKAAHDRHAEAHHLHLALFVVTNGLILETLYRHGAKLISVGRSRVAKDWDRDEILPPFFQVACLLDEGTYQGLGVVDKLRSKLRQPPRKLLIPSLVLLDRSVDHVQLPLAGVCPEVGFVYMQPLAKANASRKSPLVASNKLLCICV